MGEKVSENNRDERRGDRPATFTDETGGGGRTATDMVPGIPAGSGGGIDEALGQPDTEIGGGVAGDTTPENTEERRPAESVRNEDKERNTL